MDFYIVGYFILPIVILYGSRRCQISEQDWLSKEETTKLKGIAAILIIFHHVGQNIPINAISLPLHELGKYVVGIFFFLSGYGLIISLIKNNQYLQGFLQKRLLLIYVPFILINAIDICINSLRGREWESFEIVSTLFGFTLLDGALWYIQLILMYYLVFYILFKYLNMQKAVVGLVLFSLYYFMVGYLLGLGNHMINTSFCFVFGVLIGKNKEMMFTILQRYKKILIFGAFIMALVARACVLFVSEGIISLLFTNISTLSLVAVVIFRIAFVQISNHLFCILGNISYEIYLIHMKVLSFFYFRDGISFLEIIFIFALIIPLGWLFNKFNKRISQLLCSNSFLQKTA